MSAYGALEPGSTSDQLNELTSENVGMSQQQAQEFIARFPEVVTQLNDTETGFSATIFNDNSGNLTLAFRGTEQLIKDLLFTDSLIAFNGAGYDQIIKGVSVD